jgi:hypothetical protein
VARETYICCDPKDEECPAYRGLEREKNCEDIMQIIKNKFTEGLVGDSKYFN